MSNIEVIKEKMKKLKGKEKRFADDFESKWIKEKFDEKTIVFAEDLGFLICNKQIKENSKTKTESDFNGNNAVTTSQIRNFFGEVKRIQMKVSNDPSKWNQVNTSFLLLKPKLNYMSARVLGKNQGSHISILKDSLEKALNSIELKTSEKDTVAQFNRFAEFLEAILAYHKSFGGKE